MTSSTVRIIGGVWRSRVLRFPELPELRPTPNRVRETLFNWLGQDLTGLRCLDLFAGSGALGFEAASRGAAAVVQVEGNGRAVEALRRNCDLLDAKQITVVYDDAMRFLKHPVQTFDLVFLDPPFQRALLPVACSYLESRGWLADRGRIYIEAPADNKLEEVPKSWQIHRSKVAGDVGFHLYQRTSARSIEVELDRMEPF